MKEQGKMHDEIYKSVDIHLRMMGAPSNNEGYDYLKEAIVLAVKENEMLESKITNVYGRVSKVFDCPVERVVRSIAEVIERTIENLNDNEVKEYYFGNTISNLKLKPSKLEFIAAVSERVVEKSDTMKLISEHLLKIGVPMHFKGYSYLKYAISLIIENPNLLCGSEKEITTRISEVFDTKPTAVSKAMSDAIQNAFAYRGSSEVLAEYFGNSLNIQQGKIANFEFIVAIREQIVEEPYYMKLASEQLRVMGISMKYDGFQYLKNAIALTMENEKILEFRGKALFDKLDKLFKAKVHVIQSTMAAAISSAYNTRGTLSIKIEGNITRPVILKFIKEARKQILENIKPM